MLLNTKNYFQNQRIKMLIQNLEQLRINPDPKMDQLQILKNSVIPKS